MKLNAPSRAAVTLSVGLVLLVATTIFAQQLSKPHSADKTTARLVSDMISRYHISQKQIDDRTSAKLLKRFIEELDPQKLYFLQSDIDQFEKYRTQLDDLLKTGNVDFAFEVFDTYRSRLEERVAQAHKLIDERHDFTVDEQIVIDGKELPWAKDAAELNDRWRKRIKYDLLSLKLEKELAPEDPEATSPESIDPKLKRNLEGLQPGPGAGGAVATPEKKKTSPAIKEDPQSRLHRRYDMLKRVAQSTEDNEVLEMYLSSLAHCFDPHSSYMSAQTLEDFQIQMRLSLEGIGAALRSEDGYTVVAEIVPGGAADKDGRLAVNDKILAVAQEDGEFVDIVEMKLSKVVRLIRGPKATKVRLRVLTTTGETAVYELTRQTIELKEQEVKGEIIDAGSRVDGLRGRIGVIHIPSFYRDFSGAQEGREDFKSTARDVTKVLGEFREKGGVDAIVIDLRMNGGGALSEAIEVTGLFVDKGPVVQVKEQDGTIKSHDDVDSGVAYSGPLVVICDRLSASASEIFAGAIKDYKRGVVIGDTTTHGKGTVQNVMPVSNRLFQLIAPENRGALKLTIQQFYRVNGDSTQNLGVRSDVVLPSILDHMDLGESFLDNALQFDRIDTADFSGASLVTSDIISSLQNASQQRVAAESEFQKTQKDIQRYLARKNRKTISLNEETLRKERLEDRAESQAQKKLEEAGTSKKDAAIFPESHYNNEVLHVAADYVSLLKNQKTAAK